MKITKSKKSAPKGPFAQCKVMFGHGNVVFCQIEKKVDSLRRELRKMYKNITSAEVTLNTGETQSLSF